ncbi:MAG: hypothetical protein LBS24_07045 [Clostridiales Family XIII bacterium]|jgi:hypothetical protein|nr:hypothetical protein [Clostridiales Family XIII bacterium]
MQLTLLGILALGGAILLIYFALNRRPAGAERANRRRSDDGKVIYLFNNKSGETEAHSEAEARSETEARSEADAEAHSEAESETQDVPKEFTDVEYSETETEEPDDDREK